VYFEQYVKGSNAASLAVRNIQLGMYGVPLSTGYALARDWGALRAGGVLQGFDSLTWTVVMLSVRGRGGAVLGCRCQGVPCCHSRMPARLPQSSAAAARVFPCHSRMPARLPHPARRQYQQQHTPRIPPPPPLQACGGLVVGSVVKYCDNVVKNFALAVSVILTTLVAIPVFGQVGSSAGGQGRGLQ
jgi:hypothetical protein